MDSTKLIHILLIESDEDTMRLVTRLLVNEEEGRFKLTSVPDIQNAIDEMAGGQEFDLILLEFSLVRGEGSRGVEAIRERDAHAPILFLGARKDLSMAVEAMRVGGRDFLPKEDLDVHVFPQTLIRHHERNQLVVGVEELEISRGRLEALQEMVVGVTEEIADPLARMRSTLAELEAQDLDEKAMKYLTLVRENLDRLSGKMEKLKNLKHDKTVTYIRNINMIDLS